MGKEIDYIAIGKQIRKYQWGNGISQEALAEAQGVFLENRAGKTRIAVFDRKGTNLIDFRIPADISADEYSVSVVTKPGKEYCTACIAKTITVESA